MSALPKVKGPRQGDYAVTYFALGREPVNNVHGYFINIGTFDTEREAVRVGEDARLKLKHIGGTVRVHETGHPEPLLDEKLRVSRPKSLISDNINSIYSRQHQEEREKALKEKEELDERQRQLELEAKATDDTTTLQSYSQLHIRRRTLEEALISTEQQLTQYRARLAELKTEISARDTQYPSYQEEWRQFLKDKNPNVAAPFYLTERQ